MVATSEDVARLAGVSRGAVSQILNGRGERFAEATRERVQQAALELNYQPSIAGRALARGSSDIVIALIPNTTFGGNLQEVFELLTDALAQRGLTLLLRLSASSANSLDRVLTTIKPRAVLAIMGFSDEERTMLAEHRILGISNAMPSETNPISTIAAIQARHLIERGYRRLAFAHLEDERLEFYGNARETAFSAECAAHGLPEPEVLSLHIDRQSASRALDALAERGVGVACYNDDVAGALLAAAHDRGWRVPQDIALIGLDNSPMAQLLSPPLTTIELDLGAAGRSATDWALAALDNITAVAPALSAEIRVIQGGTT